MLAWQLGGLYSGGFASCAWNRRSGHASESVRLVYCINDCMPVWLGPRAITFILARNMCMVSMDQQYSEPARPISSRCSWIGKADHQSTKLGNGARKYSKLGSTDWVIQPYRVGIGQERRILQHGGHGSCDKGTCLH